MPVSTRSKRIKHLHTDESTDSKRKKSTENCLSAKEVRSSTKEISDIDIVPESETLASPLAPRRLLGSVLKCTKNSNKKSRRNKQTPRKVRSFEEQIKHKSILDWRLPTVLVNPKIISQRYDDYFSESEHEIIVIGDDDEDSDCEIIFNNDKLIMGIHTSTSPVTFDENKSENDSVKTDASTGAGNTSKNLDSSDYEAHFVHRKKIICTPLSARQLAEKCREYDAIE